MWPQWVDIDRATAHAWLRRWELCAYSSVVTALRAQGELTKERRKVLSDLGHVLNVSIERHKTEIRRAINDEKIATVAKVLFGAETEQEWAREGRRIVPLIRRATALTAFTPLADKVKAEVEADNMQMLPPVKSKTPKKRSLENKGPVPLSELIDEEGKVHPPDLPVPVRPKSKDNLGDIIVLPSGKVVRFKEDPSEAAAKVKKHVADQAHCTKGKRKRKLVEDDAHRGAKIEVLPSNYLLPQSASSGMQPPPPPSARSANSAKPAKRCRTRGTRGRSSGSSRSNYIPQVPSLNDGNALTGATPCSGAATQQPSQAAVQKVVVVSSSGSTTPTQFVQLPRTPVTMSPSKVANSPGGTQAPAPVLRQAFQQSQPAMTTTSPTATSTAASPQQQQQKLSVSTLQQAAKTKTPGSGVSTVSPTTIQLKESIPTSAMKVIPAGTARILPKPGSAPSVGGPTVVQAVSGTGSAPLYMVASSPTVAGSPNIVRVARAVSSSGSRVVTVNTNSIRKASPNTMTLTPQSVRTLQPRSFVTAASTGTGIMRPLTNPGGPPVIVVQKAPGALPAAVKTAISGQRILQTKGGTPVVIVSKAQQQNIPSVVTLATSTVGSTTKITSSLPSLTTSTITSHPAVPYVNTTTAAAAMAVEGGSGASSKNIVDTIQSTAAQPTEGAQGLQPNTNATSQSASVIVLNLSHDQMPKTNVLSDILQANGLVAASSSESMNVSTTSSSGAPASESNTAHIDESSLSACDTANDEDGRRGLDDQEPPQLIVANSQQTPQKDEATPEPTISLDELNNHYSEAIPAHDMINEPEEEAVVSNNYGPLHDTKPRTAQNKLLGDDAEVADPALASTNDTGPDDVIIPPATLPTDSLACKEPSSEISDNEATFPADSGSSS